MRLHARLAAKTGNRSAPATAGWPTLLFAVLLLLTGILRPALAAPVERQHVMVISAYHAGLPWTDGQLAGLQEGFAAAGHPVELHIEFLDTKRYSATPEYFAHIARLLDEKYRSQKIDLVITQDDDALDFALHQRQTGALPGTIPIVFSGVAGRRTAALESEPALTGVFDDADIDSNIILLKKLRPTLQRLFFIHDQSRTGLAQAAGAAALAAEHPELRFEFLSALPARAIQARLAELDANGAVIMLTFNRDSEGRQFSHAEASQLWAAAAQVPLIAKEDGMLVPGVLGGLVVSSHRQGLQAAQLASRILAGEDPETMPLSRGWSEAIFDYQQLARFGIDPDLLPANAEIRNRPPSLRQTYPREFWLSLALISSLGLIALLLAVLMRRSQRAQRTLASSERNYREILAATNEAIIIQTPSGEIVEANESFSRLYGHSTADARHLSLAELSSNQPPFTQSEALQRLTQAQQDGVQVFEWHARHQNGQLFWVEVALRPAEIGGQPRLVAAVRDIEQRKQTESALRASEERYRLLLRHSPVGIVHFDLDMKITYANDRFAEILQAPRDKLIGIDLTRLRDQSPIPACRQATEGMPGYFQGEYQSTLSGHRTWVSFRTAPAISAQGELIGGIGIVEDISARIAAEKAVLQLNEDLEHRVAERTTALVKANAEIKAAMTQLAQAERLAALGSLVAGVAHELNTPLGNANTVASTLRGRIKELKGSLDAGALSKSALLGFMSDISQASALIERNIERAAELISSFKQVAVDQTSIRRRRFDLAQAVEEMLATLRPRLKRTVHQLKVEIPAGIVFDSYPGPLEQIVANLVLNSLTHAFTAEMVGEIALSAHREGDEAVLEYCDNGRGMDTAEASRAFDPFFTTRLGNGGSGLGLYITHNLANDVLGGKLQLDTAPGQGVRYTLRLPLNAPFKIGES